MSQIFNSSDTICAISTPSGTGGIAVIRVSGPDAVAIVGKLWQGRALNQVESHTAHLGNITYPGTNSILDQAVATVFRAPRSFTGDDVVELSIHGSRWIQRELIALLIDAGCRLANPGEFTRRAFLAGKMDLAEAEGVADLIASSSRASHSLAINQMRGTISKKLEQLRNELIDLASLLELELDFSEEEVEFASRERLIQLASDIHDELCRLGSSFRRGNAIKEGIPVAIVGQTNAGKSSLLNAILGDDRAIVSDIHGTTRDTVEETIELGDHIFRFIDTAGLRHTDDEIEKIGIERSILAMKRARLVIVVIDATRPADRELLDRARQTDAEIIIALNKSDLNPSSEIENTNFPLVRISAKTGQGISSLLEAIEHTQAAAAVTDADVILTNARHAESIARATDDIRATVNGLTDGIPVDLVAQDLRSALHHLSAITGAISTPEILATVFSRFCIGK